MMGEADISDFGCHNRICTAAQSCKLCDFPKPASYWLDWDLIFEILAWIQNSTCSLDHPKNEACFFKFYFLRAQLSLYNITSI